MIRIRIRSRKIWVIAVLVCLFCLGSVQQVSASENVVISAKKVYGGKWKKTRKGRMYCYSKTAYAKDGWRRIGKHVYYFDKKGICRTGWITYGGQKYYANKKGRLYIGKWVSIDGKRYYFAADGRLQKNKFIESGGRYYYVNKNGVNVRSKWVTKKGRRYYIDRTGARLQSTWLKTADGRYYYLESNGVMARNKYIGSNYVGPDGAKTDPPQNVTQEYIFVGDSRTVGMEAVRQNENTTYIGKVSMGYQWLSGHAGKTLQKHLDKNPTAKVIFAFGINDLGNVDHYISYYRSMMQKYPQARFYVMSVNPVEHKKAKKHNYTVKNAQIKEFNTAMQVAFGSSVYIDTYTYLQQSGFETVDGIHYTPQTYGKIYDYVISKIR